MEITDSKVKKLLILNYTATFIIIVFLFYTFYTFKQLHYFIVGIVGIFFMIISSCFQCYFCRILIMHPYAIKIRKFVILLALMYLGIFMLILTITLNKSWGVSFIFTIVLQVLYSFISFYALFKLIRKRPFANYGINQTGENIQNSQTSVEQVAGAYSPDLPNDGGIFVPPEPFPNYDTEIQAGDLQDCSSDSVCISELGRSLTSGLYYSRSFYQIEKSNSLADNNNSIELRKRSSSIYEDYGNASNSNVNIDINSTGAVSEYQIHYGSSDDSQLMCNPYANKHSDNIF